MGLLLATLKMVSGNVIMSSCRRNGTTVTLRRLSLRDRFPV